MLRPPIEHPLSMPTRLPAWPGGAGGTLSLYLLVADFGEGLVVLSLVYLLEADFGAAACSLQWFACSWLCFTTAAGSLLYPPASGYRR